MKPISRFLTGCILVAKDCYVGLAVPALIIFQPNIFHAQQETTNNRFGLHMTVGLNLSQLDGDGIRGYNKPGLFAGMQVSRSWGRVWEWQTGLAYSEQGSQSRFLALKGNDARIGLRYMVIPLEIHFKDWQQVSGYYKIRFLLAVNYSRLFDYVISNPASYWPLNNFAENDLSWSAGFLYQLNKHWSIGLRYSRSFTYLYDAGRSNFSTYNTMLGYFLNLRLTYSIRA